MNDSKQRYLDADTAGGKELMKWTEAEGSGPMSDVIALLKFQMAEAARLGNLGLIRDIASVLNQCEKTRAQQKLSLGHLFTKEQVERIGNGFSKIIMSVLQERLPEGEWQDAADEVAERWQELRAEEQRRAAGEITPATTKRLPRPESRPARYRPPEASEDE